MNPTLEWIYRAEQQNGGIAAWQLPNGSYHSSYIEVSGYLLPTLVKWDAGRLRLAIRVANWLLSEQNPDGSFNGLDGVPRPFDTSAVIEGLEAMYKATGTAIYRDGANRAIAWCKMQITEEGYLKNSPGNYEANIYQLRAAYIIGNKREVNYWKARGLIHGKARSHYLAYALEGLLNFGEMEFALPYLKLAYTCLLQPFHVDPYWQADQMDHDYCASAQMAILFHRLGWDVTKHYEAIKKRIKEDGGVPQSTGDPRSIAWGAKFMLDLTYTLEGVK